MDEGGVELSSADTKLGKSLIGQRVSQMSRTRKIQNTIYSLLYDPNNPHCWRDIWTREGTTGRRMIAFIQQIINDIGTDTPARRYTFIMDNLRYNCLLLLFV